MNIGSVIKEVRKKKQMTQQDLAHKSKVTPAYLSKIERNERKAGSDVLNRISKALDVPLPVLSFMAFDLEDVPKHKKEVFELVVPQLKKMIGNYFIETS